MNQSLPLLLLLTNGFGQKKQGLLGGNNELFTLMQALMPGPEGRAIAAISAATEVLNRPMVPKAPPELPDLLHMLENKVSKSTLMMLRLFSAFQNMGNFDPDDPADMTRILTSVLPPEMVKNMPDMETMMNMMQVMQSMDFSGSEEDAQEAEAGEEDVSGQGEPFAAKETAPAEEVKEEKHNRDPVVFNAMNAEQRRQFSRILSPSRKAGGR